KEKNRELLVWCFKSDGLNKVNHLEVVIMLEIKRKEDVFPEEVLRVYKGILFLATKYGNYFEHGNFLTSNEQFLDNTNDAGLLFVSSEIKPKPPGLKEVKTPFLYGILFKRTELSAAMFTPSRLLLRLGYDMRSFPFPLWNSRDRRPVSFGDEDEDRFYHTVFAMNKYL
ncbi:PREDICTED: zinc finger FYVE domain-containing protein 16-like, partial [Acropora digitifera]|uniref:zinc finger FYVE domain-containing protein 16-like n=1 Tax=Acropora digitifera TaxID=70779 RepID=UPI00077A36BC